MSRDFLSTDRPLRVVVNPSAGRGRARRRGDELSKALAHSDLPHERFDTNGHGDAVRFAATAPGPVVVVGGDGTVHEVLNGLPCRDGRFGPIAVLPSGSGDDFASSAGFAARPAELVERLRHGTLRTVDCGDAVLTTATGVVTRRFANELSVGFEADVMRAVAGVPLRGRALYLLATLRALVRQRPFAAEVECDGAPAAARPLLLASFCNSRRVGGGLPFVPHARLDDGRLDLIEVAATTRLGTLALLGKLVRQEHLADPRVRTTPLVAAVVRVDQPLAVVTDGEIVEGVRELRVRVVAGSLVLWGAR
jgi:diacylglycerol kinase family enzyme